jgi:NAD(P)H-hydrate epimerase
MAVNPTGNPGMACGGMGDVLSGVIGGFLAQSLSPWQAGCLGVFSHGLAADRLAAETRAGYLASEVAHELPFVLEELRNWQPLQNEVDKKETL